MPDLTLHEAALADILDNPGDDTPRLVYADFLMENGEEERGEFIKVQIALAECDRREVELLNEDTDWSECSPLSASWCPNCGDCCCPFPEDGRDDPRCPLHSPKSRHCCLDELHDEAERLRRRERELLEQFSGIRDGDKSYTNLAWWSIQAVGFAFPHHPWESVTFRRGFVAEVTLTCRDFVGGPCKRCSGNGKAQCAAYHFEWNADVDYGKCVVCCGTGRAEGHAGALFRSCPLQKVTLSDKRPGFAEGFSGGEWYWSRAHTEQGQEHEHTEYWLPAVLFDRLPGPGHNIGRNFSSEGEANDALNAACLLFGVESRKAARR